MLRRRHFHLDNGYTCVMCNLGAEEDILHLFFDCPFAQSSWQTLQIQWNNDSDLISKLIQARVHNNHILFMEIFLVAAWELWKLINAKIFNQETVSRQKWVSNFKNQVHLHLLRVKETLHPQLVQWIETIV